MPSNVDNLFNNLDNILENEAQKTDSQLEQEITSKTSLSKEQLDAICPQPGDKQKLAELIQIVNSAEDTNNKINRITSNTEKFGGIVVNALKTLL